MPWPKIVLVALGVFLAGCSHETINLAAGPTQFKDLVIVFQNIIRLLAPTAAIAFLIMLIWGGFQFLTSGGDAKAAAAARTTLTYAVIGIILVVVSWLILLIVRNITGVGVTTVNIPETQ